MVRSATIGAAIALILAGTAAAEPFQSFADICITMNAERRAVMVDVSRNGWVDVTDQMPYAGVFQDTVFYLSVDPGRPEGLSPGDPVDILVVGRAGGEAVMGVNGVDLEICSVMSPAADAEDLKARLTAYLGVPFSTNDENILGLYSRQDGRFVSEVALLDAEEGAIAAAAAQRHLYAAYVMEMDDLAGLVLAAVRPSR